MSRVLVVDDQNNARSAIAMVLRIKGFEVIAVECGAAGSTEFGDLDSIWPSSTFSCTAEWGHRNYYIVAGARAKLAYNRHVRRNGA
jgi:hypothetical protein